MTTRPEQIAVTVVDDHSLFAESLVLGMHARGIDACSVRPVPPTTSTRVFESISRTGPDLVLLDLDLGPGIDVDEVLKLLTRNHVAVVVVTGSGDIVRQGEAVLNGAAAIISKTEPFAEILGAIDRLRDGLPLMTKERRGLLISAARERSSADKELNRRLDQLTAREAEVLGLLMDGHPVGEIARMRVVSESTVRTQVKSLLAKLQVPSQLVAVGLTHNLGWQPPRVVLPTPRTEEPPTRARDAGSVPPDRRAH